ncbi:hypothetical protein MNBD_PLANCTO02-1884 [hydrothermal vent metagenome]|uniref:Uncharacterized protein n=1 Tax=hydrothermal vent metagenome TaxID=652676 RepID=A0A3B1E5K7_9ZZZZ
MRLKSKNLLTLFLCTASFFYAINDVSAEKKAQEIKEYKIKDIVLQIPASWKQSKPTSRLRLAQFKVPVTEGDLFKTELQVFNFGGGGGGFAANIKRWENQFSKEGRQSTLTKGTCPQGDYYFLDITGTYNMSVGPPFQRKTEACKKARMLAVILQMKGNKGNYFLKLPGTQETVKGIVEDFRASFGANEKKETAVKR